MRRGRRGADQRRAEQEAGRDFADHRRLAGERQQAGQDLAERDHRRQRQEQVQQRAAAHGSRSRLPRTSTITSRAANACA